MVTLFRILFLVCFDVALTSSCFSQEFEGTITLHVVSDEGDNTVTLKVRDNKSIREVQVDSSESITIIKDFAKEKFPLFGGAIDKLFSKYNTKESEDFLDS